jgi:RNA polymerase sigma-70 factor (ECF subfamily)
VDDGREASFEDIYRRHAGHVYRFVLYLTRNSAVAEDVTSETFLRIWSSHQQVRAASVRAYLLTIARNLVYEDARRRRRESELTETAAAERFDEHIDARRELKAVFDALTAVPELDRAALLLRTEGELGYDEIARILGLSEAAVRVRVCRVRARMIQAREGVSK